MKVITDSSALYSLEEGKELGIEIVPSCVIIQDKIYKDFVDISSEAFLKVIEEGQIPTTSQPSVGEVLEVLERIEEESLFLPIGDGLSGTYQNVMGARNSLENHEHIHVMNTKTLAGPQRYIVRKALQLRDIGLGIEKIKEELHRCIETSVSFVIPADFNFLKRSGRLTPIAAKIGSLIKIVPVLTQTADKARIEPFTIKRTSKKAVEAIVGHFKSIGVDKDYLISIGHAGDVEKARQILRQIKAHFEQTEIELLGLSPSLICHGGPGCVTIQAVKK